MKILIITDKSGTAIDRLAWMIAKNHPYHDIRVQPVHPKRNDTDTIYELGGLTQWADIIDIHYWKSGDVLMSVFANIVMKKPRVLFHFNPYDLKQQDWLNVYDKVVVGNEEMYSVLPYATLIPYGVDLSFFRFNQDYTKQKQVMMSVSRIEGKKGVFEVAKACKELDYKFVLVGRVSNGEYMQNILNLGGIEFYENADDEKLREVYYQSAIHVCNSVDGFESGTLPILEAMACGVPVLTRNIGHVPDLYNGKNMVIRSGKEDDVEDLKANLKEMMDNEQWRLKIREAAFDTVRNRDSRMMTGEIMKMYNKVYMPDRKLISIVIPTRDNPESFTECLVAAAQQDYKKFEIVVADSGETSVKRIVEELKKRVDVPVKYIHFEAKGNYTLAEARNRAAIEAEGEVLVFCDDRIKMQSNAITEFAKFITNKAWVWGIKDDTAKGFVENFSAVLRSDFISHGMFSERMQFYGGMSQEIRTRFEVQNNFTMILVDTAKAYAIKRSKSKSSRRFDIIEAKYLIYKMYGR